MTEERFKMPTDDQLIKLGILMLDGKIDQHRLAEMCAMCELVLNRLYENGDITIAASTE